jgi:hypothetical protein
MPALGLIGLGVPEEYGGANLDTVSTAIAMEELGWACGSTALSLATHNGLCCAPIAAWGTAPRCRHHLNRLFAHFRILAEHTINRLRRFQAITQTDRHHRRYHTARTRAIAGLVKRHLCACSLC